MPFADVNWIALLAATAAGFAFGAVWYMSLSKPWLTCIGKSAQQMKANGPSLLPFLVSAVGLFVMAFVLMQLLVRLDSMSVGAALKAAAILWLGFILTTQAVNHSFQQMPRRLTLID